MANNNRKVKVCYVAPCTRVGIIVMRNTNRKFVAVCAPHADAFKETTTAPAARA